MDKTLQYPPCSRGTTCLRCYSTIPGLFRIRTTKQQTIFQPIGVSAAKIQPCPAGGLSEFIFIYSRRKCACMPGTTVSRSPIARFFFFFAHSGPPLMFQCNMYHASLSPSALSLGPHWTPPYRTAGGRRVPPGQVRDRHPRQLRVWLPQHRPVLRLLLRREEVGRDRTGQDGVTECPLWRQVLCVLRPVLFVVCRCAFFDDSLPLSAGAGLFRRR